MPLGTFMNGGTAAQLRGLMWLSLSDTGEVGTRTSTSDTGGGVTQIWNYGPSVPCRVDPVLSRGDNEDVVAGRMADESTHVITLPPGTTVHHKDRFRVTNRGTFEITAVRTRTDEWARFLEAVEVS